MCGASLAVHPLLCLLGSCFDSCSALVDTNVVLVNVTPHFPLNPELSQRRATIRQEYATKHKSSQSGRVGWCQGGCMTPSLQTTLATESSRLRVSLPSALLSSHTAATPPSCDPRLERYSATLCVQCFALRSYTVATLPSRDPRGVLSLIHI